MNGAFVYILRCIDGSYYTGITRRDLEERISEHQNGVDPKSYTFSRRPVVLIWNAHFDRIDEAVETERRVKGWSRAEKEAMMRGDYNALPDLAARRMRSNAKGGCKNSASS